MLFRSPQPTPQDNRPVLPSWLFNRPLAVTWLILNPVTISFVQIVTGLESNDTAISFLGFWSIAWLCYGVVFGIKKIGRKKEHGRIAI